MKKDRNIFYKIMIIVLIVIGILQFFELPKIIDYVLGVIALLLGFINIYIKR